MSGGKRYCHIMLIGIIRAGYCKYIFVFLFFVLRLKLHSLLEASKPKLGPSAESPPPYVRWGMVPDVREGDG